MKKISIVILSIVMVANMCTVKNVHAQSITKQTENKSTSKVDFRKTEPSIIAKMKNHPTQNVSKSLYSSQSYSNTTANLLSLAGFTDSAYLLNYSMLPLREEPLELYETSNISKHIWDYSPDFKSKVITIINQARSANSHEYFRTTSLNFNMPTESKLKILANQTLKRRTDLFGSLHGVTLNIGIVRSGLTWEVLIMIEDRYNFKLEEYNSLTNLVNNLAVYDQISGAIKPYNIIVWGNRNYKLALPFGCITW